VVLQVLSHWQISNHWNLHAPRLLSDNSVSYFYPRDAVTKSLCTKFNSFDIRCLRKILRIPYTRHVTNTKNVSLSDLVQIHAIAVLWSSSPGFTQGRSSQNCRGSTPSETTSRMEATSRSPRYCLATYCGKRPQAIETFLSGKQRMISPISCRPNFTKYELNTLIGVAIKNVR